MLRKQKTLQEIAREAGVSITAASMYLNGKAATYRLSASLCARIQAVIEREHYQPNVNARAINRKRTDLIGCLTRESMSTSFWADIFAGMDDTLAAAGKHIMPSFCRETPEKELAGFDFLRSKAVDGYIWVPVITTKGRVNWKDVQEYAREKPIVTLTMLLDECPGVCVDEQAGGQLAAEHFWNMGHRELAVLGDDPVLERSRVFSCAMKQHSGITPHFCSDASQVTKLARQRKITGVFCFTDELALRLYQKCAEEKVAIPEQLSVIGYDNMPFSQYLFPALTTIHQPKFELGKAAAELLLETLNGTGVLPHQKKLSPTLIKRNSVAQITA